jgi:hypothetical protein
MKQMVYIVHCAFYGLLKLLTHLSWMIHVSWCVPSGRKLSATIRHCVKSKRINSVPSEIPVTISHSTGPHIPQDLNIQPHCCEHHRSHTSVSTSVSDRPEC